MNVPKCVDEALGGDGLIVATQEKVTNYRGMRFQILYHDQKESMSLEVNVFS